MMDYTSKKLESIFELLPKNKKLKIIDIGCHKGEVTSFLSAKGFDILGIDMNKSFIDSAKKSFPSVKFETKNAYDIKFSSYDVVIAWGLFEYLLDLPKFLAKLERELHDGATVVFSVPNVCSISKRARSILGKNPNREKIPHLTFTFKEVEDIVGQLKFREKEIRSINIDCIKNFCFPAPRSLSNNIIVRLKK